MSLGEIRLTIKELANEFGLSTGQVSTVIKEGDLEAVRENRDEGSAITFNFSEFQIGFVEREEKLKHTSVEHASELIRRILPEIKSTTAETVRQEINLGIAIRDSKEARLVELVGTLMQLVVENRASVNFLVKIASQLSNSLTVANLANSSQGTFPTLGVGRSKVSVGVDLAIPKNPKDDRDEINESILADFGNHHEGTRAKEARTPPRTAMRAASARKSAGGIENALPTAVNNGVDDDFLQYQSPILKKMLPSEVPMSSDERAVIRAGLSFVENVLSLSNDEMRNLDTHDQNKIEELLKPWEVAVSDAPRFTTFFSSLTNIKEWVNAKSDKVPPLIMFLTLNKVSLGSISPLDFLLMTGLDEYYSQ